MSNYLSLSLFSLVLIVCSCREDTKLPSKPKVSIAPIPRTFYENKGITEFEILLDKPCATGLYVEYKLEGSVVVDGDDINYSPDCLIPRVKGTYDPYSKMFSGTGGVFIPAGISIMNIEVLIYQDVLFENEEQLEITLISVSPEADIDLSQNQATLSISDETSGLLVELEWDHREEYNIDMDLIVWMGDPNLENPAWRHDFEIIGGSVNAGYLYPEKLFIPLHAPDTQYAFSLVLYGANFNAIDTVEHTVILTPIRVGEYLPSTRLVAKYTDVNINAWESTEDLLQSQLFVNKSGPNFTYSGIFRAFTGSRTSQKVKLAPRVKLSRNP